MNSTLEERLHKLIGQLIFQNMILTMENEALQRELAAKQEPKSE